MKTHPKIDSRGKKAAEALVVPAKKLPLVKYNKKAKKKLKGVEDLLQNLYSNSHLSF